MITATNISKTYSSSGMFTKLLSAMGLKKTVDSTAALKNINIAFNDGQIVGIIGPNGAGKTTFVKILTGLLFPTTGSVEVNGFNPLDLSQEYKMQVGLYRGDVKQLDENVVIRDLIEDRLKMYGKQRIEENEFVQGLIQVLQVDKFLDRTVDSLSLGQSVLMEVLIASAHCPKVMLLDEPTNGLDVLALGRLKKAVHFLKGAGATVLFTSHNLHSVVDISDRIVLINRGEVVLDGTPSELLKSADDKVLVKIILSQRPSEGLLDSLSKEYKLQFPFVKFYAKRKELAKMLTPILNACDVEDLEIEEIPIEKIFSRYYK